MKLNLGCGFQKLQGYVNVDADPLCEPEVLHDLEIIPWPFEDNTVDSFVACHVLEHLGERSKDWIAIWKEIWRIAKPDATIEIYVPHPRHDNFLIDPTHVRPIFPETIAMFDQMRNIRNFESGGSETKLGLMCGLDLEVVQVGYDLEEPWQSALKSSAEAEQQVKEDLAHLNNVCFQIRMQVKIVKPCRGDEWLSARKASGAFKS